MMQEMIWVYMNGKVLRYGRREEGELSAVDGEGSTTVSEVCAGWSEV